MQEEILKRKVEALVNQRKNMQERLPEEPITEKAPEKESFFSKIFAGKKTEPKIETPLLEMQRERPMLPHEDFGMPEKIKRFMEESADEKIRMGQIEKTSKRGKHLKVQMPRKARIPSKKFMEYPEFNMLTNNLKELRWTAEKNHHIASRQLEEDSQISEKELLKISEKIQKIKEDILKIYSTFK